MKKSLILGLLGLAATAMTTFGQGTIVLDNYNTYGPSVTYGDTQTPANGTSGALGAQGGGVTAGSWTVGLYFAIGNITGSVAADPTHIANPTTLGAFTLGTGTGSTAGINNANTPAVPGAFLGTAFPVPGTVATGGTTITVMLVAYNGANFDASTSRGHSSAFVMTTTSNLAAQPAQTGTVSTSGFSVFTSVPEPSVLALSGIGGALLMLIRRKK